MSESTAGCGSKECKQKEKKNEQNEPYRPKKSMRMFGDEAESKQETRTSAKR
jgi:hypothetical protein